MHWQQAQLQALNKFRRSSDVKSTNNWKEIKREINQLMREISTVKQTQI